MKILVIDDDAAVLEYVAKILALANYEVLQASDGKAGLAKFAADPEIAIVVTDLIMPGKEGIETIMEIKKSRPKVKVVAMSGGGKVTPELYLKCAGALGADATLQKPFARADLLRVISGFASDVAVE